MKKFFTLIAAALMAVGVNAQTVISLGGLEPSDFTYTEGEFEQSSKDVEVEDGSTQTILTISYVKKDKANWSDLALNGTPVVFQYKNSGAKADFYQLYADYIYTNGKQSNIKISGLKAGQVVTLKAAAKGGTDAVFAAFDNCTAAEDNPASVSKSTVVDEFADFNFTVKADGDIIIQETDGGFNLASITINEGEGVEPVDPVDPSTAAAIDYPTSEDGITLVSTEEGQISFSTVKIHENTDEVPCIKFGKSYKYEAEDGSFYAKLEVEGGFKAGDVITIAGVYNNKDEKSAAIAFRSDPTSEEPIWLTDAFINGRLVADDPAEQTFTLTEDAEALYIGRSGGTGTCITLLTIVRGDTTGVNVLPVSMKVNGAIFNLAGQQVSKAVKGVYIQNGKKFVVK
jgi:hypothetical protein